MRTLRIIMTVGGAAPAIAAVALIPAADACGGQSSCPAPVATSPQDASRDEAPPSFFDVFTPPRDGNAPLCEGALVTQIVPLPPPGVPAAPGQLCAVATPPASSDTSARVTLTRYSPQTETAFGFVAIPPSLEPIVVGNPTLTVATATVPAFATMQVSSLARTTGGFEFQAKWPSTLPHPLYGGEMTVKAAFAISCDAGAQNVEAVTRIHFCVDDDSFEWVSAGDACTVCRVIAEMAPSPIVSDNRGDDLPLGRPLRLRVVELARVGRTLLLFAENDAGGDADYEWRVSGGTLEHVAPDVVLWTPPGETGEAQRPYGQVAVWNEEGAAVENFLWGVS